jgi:hypothetical protein
MKCKLPTTILITATAIGFAAVAFRAIRLTTIGLALGGSTVSKPARKKSKQPAPARPTKPYANQQP